MKLSKTSTLAALAVAHLSKRQDEGYVQARQVAEYLSIPTDSALKVLQALARRGLIKSQLGRSGGYRLDREPGEVTLREIVEAVDGPIEAEVPIKLDGNGLDSPLEQIQRACNRVANSIRTELDRTSVSDLADLDADQIIATIEHGVAH